MRVNIMTTKTRIPLIVAGFVLLVGSSALATPYSLNAPAEPNLPSEAQGRVRHHREPDFGLVTPDSMMARPAIATRHRRSPSEVQLAATSIPVL